MAKVAIITRTRSRPLLLRRAAVSITAQHFRDYLWMVVNDGGDLDELESVLAPHRPLLGERLNVLHNPRSIGMEAASNMGIRASDSEFLVIHDDDDSWEPEFLKATVSVLEQPPHPSVRAVVSHCTAIRERIDGDRIIEESRTSYNGHLNQLPLWLLLRENPHPPISFVYRRDVHDLIGYYDETLPVLGDWEFFLRFYRRFEAFLLPRHLANYHLRPAGTVPGYGNSVTAGIDKHAFYGQLLWNRLLRDDLDQGRVDLGVLANLARQMTSPAQHKPFATVSMFLKPLSLIKTDGRRRLVICTAGQAGRSAAALARLAGCEVVAFIDRNPDLIGKQVDGAPVEALENAAGLGADAFLVGSVAFADEVADELRQELARHGVVANVYLPAPLP